jgi:hypothetical protein
MSHRLRALYYLGECLRAVSPESVRERVRERAISPQELFQQYTEHPGFVCFVWILQLLVRSGGGNGRPGIQNKTKYLAKYYTPFYAGK